MRFLFIYVTPPLHICYTKYNAGIASLSAVLKQKNHRTDLLCIDRLNKKKLNAEIEHFNPDLIGCSFVSHQKALAGNIIEYISQYHNKTVIVGGVHATVAPKECLQMKGVLGVCVGEGDLALAEFVDSYARGDDYRNTSNFYFKDTGELLCNPVAPLIQNLDDLPFPDRKLFEYAPSEAMLGLEFFFSRGCPYKCSYCINGYLQDLYKAKGPYVRFRSPQSVVREIQKTVELYNYNGNLTFHDDTFTLKKTWLKEFSPLYKEKVGLPYRCNSTADKVDEEIAQYLKDSNCKEVWFGIETGFEDLRKEILNKKILDNDIIRAGNILYDVGISPCSFNMLGIPGESEDNIKRLIEINIKAKIIEADVSIIQPYPGTKLYEHCVKENSLYENQADTASLKALKHLKISDVKLYKYFFLFNHYILGKKNTKTLNFLLNFSFFIWLRRKAQNLPNWIKKVVSSRP